MPLDKREQPAPAFVRNSAYCVGIAAIPTLWVMVAMKISIPFPIIVVTALLGLNTIGYVFTGKWPHLEILRLLSRVFRR